ncbi:trypsin-like isoform X2 [Drosophila hydei]|uniref:trypsin n=1 Tax=Drosophila hydei TaxID=7224 RepID=A0A6J1M9Y6_DROHY|nr:trypsin-like isoform X2 [Drosophila hydei]
MTYRNLIDIQILLILLGIQLLDSDERVKRLATPSFTREALANTGKYVVSIRSRTPHKYFGDNHFCAGSIVSPIFVLTAAQCVMKWKVLRRSRVLLIVAGAPNRLKFFASSLHVPVKTIFVPQNYTVFNTNNIALLKTSLELPTNNFRIGIARLPISPAVNGLYYRSMGWGRIFKGGPLASSILFIDVLLHDFATCKRLIRPFTPDMLCVGNLHKPKLDEHPCSGDAGDPLILNNTVYGVATYGLGCGNNLYPSVYTNVWYHMDWMRDIMERNNCGKAQCLTVYVLIALYACSYCI